MKVVSLGGAGGMGTTASRHLVAQADIDHVVVADLDGAGARALAAELTSSSTTVSAATVDVLDRPALVEVLREADLVLNTAGPFFRLGVPALEAALEAATTYLDICDDPEPTLDMLALYERARSAGVTAVVGMGASPGLSNLMAARAATRLDRVIDCFTAWPLDVSGPGDDDGSDTGAGAAVSAAAVHLMEQISGTIRVVEGGELVAREPLEPVTLSYPGAGTGTGYTVGHPEPLTLLDTLGVTGRAANLMLVRKTTVPYLRSLQADLDRGTLSHEEAAAELLSPTARRAARAVAKGITARGPGSLPPFFVLLCGERGDSVTWVGSHVTTLPPGMDGATAIPAVLAVSQLLRGGTPAGVHAPESVIEPDQLLEALAPLCPGTPATVDELAPVVE